MYKLKYNTKQYQDDVILNEDLPQIGEDFTDMDERAKRLLHKYKENKRLQKDIADYKKAQKIKKLEEENKLLEKQLERTEQGASSESHPEQ